MLKQSKSFKSFVHLCSTRQNHLRVSHLLKPSERVGVYLNTKISLHLVINAITLVYSPFLLYVVENLQEIRAVCMYIILFIQSQSNYVYFILLILYIYANVCIC